MTTHATKDLVARGETRWGRDVLDGSIVPNRTTASCKNRWHKHLSPDAIAAIAIAAAAAVGTMTPFLASFLSSLSG